MRISNSHLQYLGLVLPLLFSSCDSEESIVFSGRLNSGYREIDHDAGRMRGYTTFSKVPLPAKYAPGLSLCLGKEKQTKLGLPYYQKGVCRPISDSDMNGRGEFSVQVSLSSLTSAELKFLRTEQVTPLLNISGLINIPFRQKIDIVSKFSEGKREFDFGILSTPYLFPFTTYGLDTKTIVKKINPPKNILGWSIGGEYSSLEKIKELSELYRKNLRYLNPITALQFIDAAVETIHLNTEEFIQLSGADFLNYQITTTFEDSKDLAPPFFNEYLSYHCGFKIHDGSQKTIEELLPWRTLSLDEAREEMKQERSNSPKTWVYHAASIFSAYLRKNLVGRDYRFNPEVILSQCFQRQDLMKN